MSTLEQIKAILLKRAWHLATAESCTAGSLAAALTSISGSSDYFSHGWVTYSKEAKIDLGVPSWVIQSYTVYSENTAKAMASNARELSGADFGIGVTGVLGPGSDQGCDEGNVWIFVTDGFKHQCLKLGEVAGKDRTERRSFVVEKTLEFVLKFLVDADAARR